jgi:hypothetical protein
MCAVKSGFSAIIAASAFLLVGIGMLFAKAPSRSWRQGHVISSILSGQGNKRIQKGNTYVDRTDVWWTYCISSEGVIYSVISRQSPEKTGLTNEAAIQFLEIKNQIRVTSPHGKNINLRILRKGNSGKCP